MLNPPDTYFLKVTDGPDLRDVSDQMRKILKVRAMERWMDDQLESNDVYMNFRDADYAWVIDQVRKLPSLDTS